MLRLANPIQHYPWGSLSAIPKLLGQPPGELPAAELWMGAHVRGPSVVLDAMGGTLADRIAADPVATLGADVAGRFGELPFLLKILAAARPLSLQAHPSKTQAAQGFAREEAAGIDRAAPERTYRDANHKPELLCALERFEMLCGFREPAQTAEFVIALGVEALEPWAALIGHADPSEALRSAFAWTQSLTAPDLKALFGPLTEAFERVRWSDSRWAQPAGWAGRLASSYPYDAGVLGALLLNDVVLQPGEAVFLGAGNLHAYLDGVGVELMANSDNVLRGGLTTKHVDATALAAVLNFEAVDPGPMNAAPRTQYERVFATSAEEFELSLIELEPDGALLHDARGPEILLCVEGACTATPHSGAPVALGPGQSVFCTPGVQRLHAPTAALLFRAAVPRVPAA